MNNIKFHFNSLLFYFVLQNPVILKCSAKLDYTSLPCVVNDIFDLIWTSSLFFLHADPLLALKNWTPTIHFSLVEDKQFSNQFEVILICLTLLLGGKWQLATNHMTLNKYEPKALSFYITICLVIITLICRDASIRWSQISGDSNINCKDGAYLKYKGFCARLGPCGKSRSLQGLLESTKKNGGSHAFFETISLESQNADIGNFLKKEEKDISSQISLQFSFTYREANKFIKILKLHGTR